MTYRVEVREGQCDFPWARQEARTFKPQHHRISRGKQVKKGSDHD